MPEGTRWRPPAGGNTVWVRLPDTADAEVVHREALAEGFAYARGGSFSLAASPARADAERHLSLGFARMKESRVGEAIAAHAKIVRRAIRAQRTRRKVA